jgi:hypothetical protein
MAAQVLTGAPATLHSALFRRGTQCISATTTDPKTVIGQLMTRRAEIGFRRRKASITVAFLL